MSDPNTNTSGPAKPSKSAGLSFYNRFACGAAALLALATAMILVSTSQASQSARDTRDEAHATLQQAGEEELHCPGVEEDAGGERPQRG